MDRSGAEPQWVIDGAKTFITNSGTAITSLVTVTALTGEGVSSTIVPTGTPGFIVEPPYRKMGWHASDTHGLVFDDCRVPESNLLGRAGQGFRQFLSTLDDGRIAIAALAVGLIQGCLDECTAYAKVRQAFGKSTCISGSHSRSRARTSNDAISARVTASPGQKRNGWVPQPAVTPAAANASMPPA